MLTVLLEYIDLYTQGECSIRVYRSNICLLCQHNGVTYYAQNYAGIIGASLLNNIQQTINSYNYIGGIRSGLDIVHVSLSFKVQFLYNFQLSFVVKLHS